MSFGAFVNFNGNCRQAVTFYAKVFGQKSPRFVTYGEGETSFDPNVNVAAKSKKSILHVHLNICGTDIGFCDIPDDFDFALGNNISLSLVYQNLREATLVFKSLAENGKVIVPLAVKPGRGYFGVVQDQFGLCWMIKA